VLELTRTDSIEFVSTSEDDDPFRLEIDPIDRANDVAPVRFHRPNGVTHTAVWPAHQYEEIARSAQSAVSEEGLRTALLGGAARQFGADAFVTGDTRLLEGDYGTFLEQSTPMSSSHAAALVGLFLRLRGDFAIARDPGATFTVSPAMFYWVVGQGLIPESWRWVAACAPPGERACHYAHASSEHLARVGQTKRMGSAQRAC
jgi:hypothetical protein